MADYIREVEKIIDDFHKQSPVFSLNRKTALYHTLIVFEDMCRLGGSANIGLFGDSLDYSFLIREQLDALNILIQWIYKDSLATKADVLDKRIIRYRYMSILDLLEKQAKPYSPICSAYISYSRGQFSAHTNERQKRITFSDNPQKRSIVISDMMESLMRDYNAGAQLTATPDLILASQKLISSISFQDGHICYRTDKEVWGAFEQMMERQWTQTSELPEEWKFDAFSVSEYKQFWVTVATLCIIHMTACLKSGIKGANVEEAVVTKAPLEFTQFISKKSGVSEESTTAIMQLLTYDNHIRNNDIIYQPFVLVDEDLLALAPHLVLTSRPERNLISLIHKLRDKSYFDLTNLREGIMQDELSCIIEKLSNVTVEKNKSLPEPLPDVDYAVWDKSSNTILVCELKWLVEADSTSEVFARVQDIQHGCDQISKIVKYAQDYTLDFCNKVFGISKLDSLPQITGCVISKRGIRVDNSDIPVISTNTLLELFQHKTVHETFTIIANKAYLIPVSKNFVFGLKAIPYAGYIFEIPALLKDQPMAQGTYKRVGAKMGRNNLCSCGSKKKYKKCCGR